MLVHRPFCGVRIATGNGIGDFRVALKCEPFGDFVTVNLPPALH